MKIKYWLVRYQDNDELDKEVALNQDLGWLFDLVGNHGDCLELDTNWFIERAAL